MPNSRLRRTNLPLTTFAIVLATFLIAASAQAATYRHRFVGAVEGYSGAVPSVVSEGARVEVVFEHGDAYRFFDDTATFPGGLRGPTATGFAPLIEPIGGSDLSFRFVEAMSMTVLVGPEAGQEVVSEYRVNANDTYFPFGADYDNRPLLRVVDDARIRLDPRDIRSPVLTVDQIAIFSGQLRIGLNDPTATFVDLRPGLPTSYSGFGFDPAVFDVYLVGDPNRPGNGPSFRGSFASVTSSIVPEPSAALLIGLGLAALSRSRPLR